ncbi:MAG: hypothetical protein ACLP7J_04495 [Streptosporangiaceae bacterium]
MNVKTGRGEPRHTAATSAIGHSGPCTVFAGCLPIAIELTGPQAGIIAQAFDPEDVTVCRGWHEVGLHSPELGDQEAATERAQVQHRGAAICDIDREAGA